MDAEEDAEFEAGIVADLHAASARFPTDERLARLIDDLRARQPALRSAVGSSARPPCTRRPARRSSTPRSAGSRSTATSCMVHGTDLRIVVYSAPPGSADADALALLGLLAVLSR